MARGKITLVFDGSQDHKIDYAWLEEHARKFGMSIESYAHLGLLMLKLVEDKVLVDADHDPLAPSAPPATPDDQLTDQEKSADDEEGRIPVARALQKERHHYR